MSIESWMIEQRRSAALDAALERYPKCDCCGCAITTEKYLNLFGRNVCQECVDDNMQYNMEVITDGD